MKKLMMGLAVAAVLLFPSREGTELGKLLPVELISVSREESRILVRTDTGSRGEGASFQEAVEELGLHAPGTVCLDTADYVILDPKVPWQELTPILRPSTEVCYGENVEDLAEAAAYLRIHSPDASLRDLRGGWGKIRELRWNEGQLSFGN